MTMGVRTTIVIVPPPTLTEGKSESRDERRATEYHQWGVEPNDVYRPAGLHRWPYELAGEEETEQ